MPTIRIKYSYKNYPNCPEATKVSENRESGKASLEFLSGLGLLAGLVWVFSDTFHGVLLLVASFGLLIYLNSIYDKKTEKKILEAIKESVSAEQRLRDSKYQCESLIHLNDAGIGQCMVCYQKNVKVDRYRVKRASETREMHVCEICVGKLRDALSGNPEKNRKNTAATPASTAQQIPMTSEQETLEGDFFSTYLSSRSAPLGNKQDAWDWMIKKMHQFRQQGLEEMKLYILASNVMLYLTDVYVQRIPEFLEVAKPEMIVTLVAMLLREKQDEKAKQIAAPFWEYVNNNVDSIQLDRDAVVILAIASAFKKE